MKGVVLSEGHNDTIFLKELLIKKVFISDAKILSFDQCTREKHKNRKAIQQKYFGRLLQGYEHYDILVKSEGGKSKIIAVTASQLPYLCEQRCTPIMLIDLDNNYIVPPFKNSIESFKRDLKQEIETRFKGQQFVLNYKYVDKNKEAQLWIAEIFQAEKICGKIYVIAFYRSLEKETGINRKDKDNEKLVKTAKYLQNSTIHQLFSTALT